MGTQVLAEKKNSKGSHTKSNPRRVNRFYGEITQLVNAAKDIAKQNSKAWLLTALVVIALCLALMSMDDRLLESIRVENPSEGINALARRASYWGDFYTGTLIVCTLVWLAGWKMNAQRWQRAAVAAMIAAALAGISARGMSMVVGRPRPYMEEQKKTYKTNISNKYNSFPSGHTATSMGSAIALSIAIPPLAPPALAGATLVAWSRLQLNRHFPSDLLMGLFLAATFGVPLGLAARRK